MTPEEAKALREKAIAGICERTGKTREQAVAFLDIMRSAFAASTSRLSQEQVSEVTDE